MSDVPPISHDCSAESLEEKARWFRSLSLQERMDYLCEITELILENNPQTARVKHFESALGRVQILTLP